MGRNKETFPHVENGDVKERLWMVELYPDTTDYKCDEVLDTIQWYCDSNAVEYAYILHDKDVDEDGVFKKAHYHVALKFENPRFQNALSKRFHVPYNYFKCWDDWNREIQYLVHRNNKEKYQYDVSEIKTNILNLDDLLLPKSISEEIAIRLILDYIRTYNNPNKCIDIYDVMNFALDRHIYYHLRRSGSLFACLFSKSRYLIKD